MFHELYSISSLLCIARNVRFEIPYKVLYFETPFLLIFKYYAWASYLQTNRLSHFLLYAYTANESTLRLCIYGKEQQKLLNI